MNQDDLYMELEVCTYIEMPDGQTIKISQTADGPTNSLDIFNPCAELGKDGDKRYYNLEDLMFLVKALKQFRKTHLYRFKKEAK